MVLAQCQRCHLWIVFSVHEFGQLSEMRGLPFAYPIWLTMRNPSLLPRELSFSNGHEMS